MNLAGEDDCTRKFQLTLDITLEAYLSYQAMSICLGQTAVMGTTREKRDLECL